MDYLTPMQQLDFSQQLFADGENAPSNLRYFAQFWWSEVATFHDPNLNAWIQF